MKVGQRRFDGFGEASLIQLLRQSRLHLGSSSTVEEEGWDEDQSRLESGYREGRGRCNFSNFWIEKIFSFLNYERKMIYNLFILILMVK